MVRAGAARERRRGRAARRGRSALSRRVRRRRHATSRRARSTACPRRRRGSSRTASSSAPRSSTRRSSCGPRSFPNVAQTKFLLREGVPGPTISALTRIGTVEGFGSMIRAVSVENMQRHFAESIDGTAIAHLQARPLRSARARRSGLGGRSGAQADVVRGARHRVREPGHRGHDADDARAHGHRARRRQAADAGGDPRATPKRCAASPTSISRSR